MTETETGTYGCYWYTQTLRSRQSSLVMKEMNETNTQRKKNQGTEKNILWISPNVPPVCC